MKMFGLLGSVLLLNFTHAQFTLAVGGGFNSTTAAQTPSTTGKYVATTGWQTGLGVEYGIGHWLLYSGLLTGVNNIFYETTGYLSQQIKYKPVFVTTPIGAGYSLPVAKNIALRLYAGLYGWMGLGGRYYARQPVMTVGDPNCDPAACPEQFAVQDRRIRFGNQATGSQPDDLANFNWGGQLGVGIKAWQLFELRCMYNQGFSNILPQDLTGQTLRMRFVDVGLRVNIKTFGTAKK